MSQSVVAIQQRGDVYGLVHNPFPASGFGVATRFLCDKVRTDLHVRGQISGTDV